MKVLTMFLAVCTLATSCSKNSTNSDQQPSQFSVRIQMPDSTNLVFSRELVYYGDSIWCTSCFRPSDPNLYTDVIANVPGGIHSAQVKRKSQDHFSNYGNPIYPSTGQFRVRFRDEYDYCSQSEHRPNPDYFYVLVIAGDSSTWMSQVVTVTTTFSDTYPSRDVFLQRPRISGLRPQREWNTDITGCQIWWCDLYANYDSMIVDYWGSGIRGQVSFTPYYGHYTGAEAWISFGYHPDVATYHIFISAENHDGLMSEPSDTVQVII